MHVQELNYEKNVYELKDHVGEKALNLNLLPKLVFTKKTPCASFPNYLLKNVWIKSVFPYAPFPHHKGAKRDFIRVIKRVNTTPPHHRGLTLAYLMENKTPLIYHVIEQHGCVYTIKDNKSLNERTRGHPKTKPKSRLMQARWEWRKV